MRVFLPIALGVALTLATSLVKREAIARYADVDACTSGCTVAAAGWPLPYLVDHPGLSPTGRVSLAGAFLGVDGWRAEGLTLDLALWIVAAFVAAMVVRRVRR